MLLGRFFSSLGYFQGVAPPQLRAPADALVALIREELQLHIRPTESDMSPRLRDCMEAFVRAVDRVREIPRE